MFEKVPKEVVKFIKLNYDISDFDNIEILWDNENLVFSIKNKIFRLTNFTHRTKEELYTETKLLNILYNEWADVVKIIPSKDWNSFEELSSEKLFITSFEMAEWEIIDIKLFSNKYEIIKEWWTTMWKIHKIISINYNKLDTSNRLEWYDEIIIKNADELLPKEDKMILDILKDLIKNFEVLEKNNDEYWLVHTDMRPRNFHYSNWKIIHFDFDDISNNWYIFDIAVAIFHETEQFKTKQERTIFMKNFIIYFLEWYLKEKEIKFIYLEKMIDFMHIRLIYAYIDYYKRLKIKWLDSWKEKMLNRRKFIGSFENFININEIERVIYSFKN